MTLSRIIATGAVATLVGASVMLGAHAASADDFYVDAADFVEETAFPSYPDQWFLGDVTGGHGDISSTPAGLELDATSDDVQILNADTPATGLLGLVAGADIRASGSSADLPYLKFQIPVFGDPTSTTNKVFTTLYPAIAGPAGLDATAQWITSGAIPATGSTPAYAPSSSATLVDFEAALAAINPTTGYEVLAFGAFIAAGHTVTVSSITWAGNTHWFLPAPTATVTPASLTVDEMGETGVTGVFTGFIPGESVTASFANASSGGALPGAYTADSNGVVTVTYSVASLTPGAYFLGAFGDDSGASVLGTLTITANALAATGAEMTPAVIAGSVLLLAGAGFSIIALRRRKAVRTR